MDYFDINLPLLKIEEFHFYFKPFNSLFETEIFNEKSQKVKYELSLNISKNQIEKQHIDEENDFTNDFYLKRSLY